ncbi:MAG: hypothetical protein KJ592_00700 [Nanoarchaeota archaeon]|nr:hypothetical protein [Nanoarchaeota archaeon]
MENKYTLQKRKTGKSLQGYNIKENGDIIYQNIAEKISKNLYEIKERIQGEAYTHPKSEQVTSNKDGIEKLLRKLTADKLRELRNQ